MRAGAEGARCSLLVHASAGRVDRIHRTVHDSPNLSCAQTPVGVGSTFRGRPVFRPVQGWSHGRGRGSTRTRVRARSLDDSWPASVEFGLGPSRNANTLGRWHALPTSSSNSHRRRSTTPTGRRRYGKLLPCGRSPTVASADPVASMCGSSAPRVPRCMPAPSSRWSEKDDDQGCEHDDADTHCPAGKVE